ncbi:uncharacterized protein LOC114525172 [Dendronephthya gigantea]|uniref:uncharacterized protein LOC114525172 n=1 Tax=Dendronephthya gigantea TaxID=151771 RepID=UPI00106C5CEB|nr:uncharacterized protein LOC114525172 [Dendronephthya gigantea]
MKILRRRSIFLFIVFLGLLSLLLLWLNNSIVKLARERWYAVRERRLLVNTSIVNLTIDADNQNLTTVDNKGVIKALIHRKIHQRISLGHQNRSINHQNRSIDHKNRSIDHQNRSINHQNRSIDHQNRSIDHRTPSSNRGTQLNSTARKMLKRKEGNFKQAQDSYYGKGCKTNLYRSRLKIIFNVWREMAKRRNITRYFIAYGSFLGAVRNGDVIPYDSDIDVCIFRDEYHKLFPEESSRPLDLNDGTVHLLLQRHSPHPKDDTPRKDCNGSLVRRVADDCAILDPHARLYQSSYVYMDIFLLEDFRSVVYDEYDYRFLKRDIVLPLRPCRFLGMSTYCPNDAARYLTAYYGATYLKPHHICQGNRWFVNMPDARPRLL